MRATSEAKSCLCETAIRQGYIEGSAIELINHEALVSGNGSLQLLTYHLGTSKELKLKSVYPHALHQ